jgi:CHAD domain-containing protein/CYTH domain-containing protein
VAKFPSSILDEPTPRGARVIALALLEDAAAGRDRLSAHSRGDDPEALHDFRVAVRRFRSWVRALEPELSGSLPDKAMRRVRGVASASNTSRDAEVFIEWLESARGELSQRQRRSADWMLARLRTRKDGADREAREVIVRDFERAYKSLVRRLSSYQVDVPVHDEFRLPTLSATVAPALREHARALRERLAEVHSIADDAIAHRARIEGKRLRYLLEPFVPHLVGGAELLSQLKSLQDSLGTLHDVQVWSIDLRESLETAALEEARAALAAPVLAAPVLAVASSDATTVVRRSPSRSTPSLQAGLIRLVGKLRERGESVFTELREGWLDDRGTAFFEAVDSIAQALEEHGGAGVEIERKYLLSALPTAIPSARVKEIAQGYLPGERLVERLRCVRQGWSVKYYRTVKVGEGIVRTELEEETSRELFEVMWPLTAGRRVEKRRHVAVEGDVEWEIDEFTDRDLILAEVELDRPDVTPELPSWLAPFVVRDVTDEPEYLNVNLAR